MADKLNAEAMEYFRKHGRRGGKLGAKARMEKLSPEQRSEIARKAVRAREAKRNGTVAALEPVSTATRPVFKPKKEKGKK